MTNYVEWLNSCKILLKQYEDELENAKTKIILYKGKIEVLESIIAED